MTLASDAAYRPPVVPAVATGRVDNGTIKVQGEGVGTTADRTRPVEAAGAGIAQGTAIDIAGPHKIIRIRAYLVKTTSCIAYRIIASR